MIALCPSGAGGSGGFAFSQPSLPGRRSSSTVAKEPYPPRLPAVVPPSTPESLFAAVKRYSLLDVSNGEEAENHGEGEQNGGAVDAKFDLLQARLKEALYCATISERNV